MTGIVMTWTIANIGGTVSVSPSIALIAISILVLWILIKNRFNLSLS